MFVFQRARTMACVPLAISLALGMIASAGCRGCQRNSSEKLSREELEKKAREQKDALVTSPLVTLPADTEVKIAAAKPGHWVETIRQVKSNREDLQVIATGDVMRGADKVLNIPFTNVTPEFSRATVLPKGQTKTIDLQYFVPATSIAVDPLNPVSTALRLRSSLLSRSLLTPITQEPFATAELTDSEFFLIVVSPKPQEYAFLSATDLVLWRGTDLALEERNRSYRVILCGSKDGKLEFPSSLMTLTATAVIVWDDLAPDDLSDDQKTALVDWLHWGGQLIVSGPGSWSRLQNSFLAAYLPVRGGEAVELGTEELAPLNYWVVKDRSGQPEEPLEIVGAKMPGLRLELAEDGSWLPQADQLVAERSVGRGRLVVTAFPLRDQRLYRWKYFSSLMSTGLLRRPARTVSFVQLDNASQQVWAGKFAGDEKNPAFNSQLRFTSRDLRLKGNNSKQAQEFAQREYEERQRRVASRNLQGGMEIEPPPQPRLYDTGTPESLQWAANGAAWSDTSGFSFAAVNTLRGAAGIVLPDRLTILWLIGSYLVILVPLNWLIFRLAGRLEFAWLAAPILAIVGVLVVTRVARLDIGFARRTTEVGLVELQAEYPRAHVTNYTALYTSLSTNYALEFPERGSVALPLGDVFQRSRRLGNRNQTLQARYGTSAGIRLEPLTVRSNSTELLHSEQMVSFPGGILYGQQADSPDAVAIKNKTGLALKSCCLLRRTDDGRAQVAWLGDMPDDNSRTARFADANPEAVWEHWNGNRVTRNPEMGTDEDQEQVLAADDSALLLGGVLRELIASLPLVPGQARLIGYTDDRVGKMESQPEDGQLDNRAVIVAHLKPAQLGPITRDEMILGRLQALVEPTDQDIDEPPPR